MELFIKPHTRLLFAKITELACQLSLEKRYALITDEQVAVLYGNALKEELCAAGLDVSLFSIKAGEMFKTRQTKHVLEDALLSKGLGSETVMIALGGGVVTDVAGFVAATYCRGIPLISIPTTLLSMIDASIGGKTGVNTAEGKNLIGAYHPSSLILIDVSFLKTLPELEMRNGYAEMIKYGLIASAPLFDLLEKKRSSFLIESIQRSIEIKKKTIEMDFFEKGLRRILNFGHTFGHALEAILNYEIPHGQAVALGMAFESFLSMKLASLKSCEYERILRVLKAYDFPLNIPRHIDFDVFLSVLSRDKKACFSRVQKTHSRFVLLDAIGKAKGFEGEYCSRVDETLLREAYAHFLY